MHALNVPAVGPCVVVAAALLAFSLCAYPASSIADMGGWSFGSRPRPVRELSIDLHSRDPQPISRDLAFRVDEASVKDRQLWVIGELVNLSNTTYTQVRMVVGIEHGAEQRLTIGKLAPRASRRVQLRLATDFEHAPPELWVRLVEAKTDYRPKPYRW